MRRNETKQLLLDLGIPGFQLKGTSWDLSGVDLSGKDLRGAHLRNVDLTGAKLRGTMLQDANLSLACFRDADLTGSNREGADVTGADFDGATLDETPWPSTLVNAQVEEARPRQRDREHGNGYGNGNGNGSGNGDKVRGPKFTPSSVTADPEYLEMIRHWDKAVSRNSSGPTGD